MSMLATVDFAVLTLVMLAVLGAGIATAGSRKLALVTLAVLGLWLSLAAALARSGVLASWTPPRWPLLPVTALVATIVVSRTATVRTLLERTPVHFILLAQGFRVFVELGLFALHREGRAPVQVTFEGRNFDILVGVSAPIVAWLFATKRVRLGFVAAWNGLGLVVLANTVMTVARSTPGPLHAAGEPFTALVTWPIVWLPAFLMPLAVFFHVCSLRQTRLSTSVAPR